MQRGSKPERHMERRKDGGNENGNGYARANSEAHFDGAAGTNNPLFGQPDLEVEGQPSISNFEILGRASTLLLEKWYARGSLKIKRPFERTARDEPALVRQFSQIFK